MQPKKISISCITLQYIVTIVMYYNAFCLNGVNIQSLHCKNDWNSGNLDYTVQFLRLYRVYSFQSHIAIWQFISIYYTF